MKFLRKCLIFMALCGVFIIIQETSFLHDYFAPLNKMLWLNYKCPDVHVITVIEGGQLANHIWEYMSLIALIHLYEDKLNFTPYIHKNLKTKVESVFEKVNVLDISSIPKFCLMQQPYVLLVNESFNVDRLLDNISHPLIIDRYSARYEEIIHYGIRNIKNELRFHKKNIEYSYSVFNQIKIQFNLSQNTVTYIGMHYRGNDYVCFLKKNYKNMFSVPPNATYYLKAMNYFEKKYETVVFILITIDYQWLAKNLPFLEKKFTFMVNPNDRDPVKDLTLLSHCNHSIINYGTYGTAGALFADGTTFVYDLSLPLDHRGFTIAMGITKILPNWHLIK